MFSTVNPKASAAQQERRQRERAAAAAYSAEMEKRRREMRALHPLPAPRPKAAHLDDDLDAFEGVMFALMASDFEEGSWCGPDSAPPFAALLVRIAEQTVAEFGRKAAQEAFEILAEKIERPK